MYSLSYQAISRSDGRSACACASYRSGEMIQDEYYGLTHDYSHRDKKGDILHSEIINWLGTRSELWNEAERCEKRKDSRVARELLYAIPEEASKEEAIQMCQRMGNETVETFGVAVDLSIHHPSKYGDQRNRHCHQMMTTRLSAFGDLHQKVKALDQKEVLQKFRKQWEVILNDFYQSKGIDKEVSCLSYEKQGLEKLPTIHVGAKLTNMERSSRKKGENWKSDRTKHNEWVQEHNLKITMQTSELDAQFEEVAKQLEQEKKEQEDVRRREQERQDREIREGAERIERCRNLIAESARLEQEAKERNRRARARERETQIRADGNKADTSSPMSVLQSRLRQIANGVKRLTARRSNLRSHWGFSLTKGRSIIRQIGRGNRPSLRDKRIRAESENRIQDTRNQVRELDPMADRLAWIESKKDEVRLDSLSPSVDEYVKVKKNLSKSSAEITQKLAKRKDLGHRDRLEMARELSKDYGRTWDANQFSRDQWMRACEYADNGKVGLMQEYIEKSIATNKERGKIEEKEDHTQKQEHGRKF